MYIVYLPTVQVSTKSMKYVHIDEKQQKLLR